MSGTGTSGPTQRWWAAVKPDAPLASATRNQTSVMLQSAGASLLPSGIWVVSWITMPDHIQVYTCTSQGLSVRFPCAKIPCVGRESVFRALAEPRRQAILRLVRDQPRSAGEIGEHFDITQQAVSQHLQILVEADLVKMRKDGKRRLYVVNPEGLEALERFLTELWPLGLRRLKKAVESNRGR